MNYNHTVFKALQWAFLILDQTTHDRSDAEYLMEHWQKWNHTQLLLHYRDELSEQQWQTFQNMIQRVVNDEPPQYIIGTAPFNDYEFKVTPAVLIPRLETEELCQWALVNIKQHHYQKILDIGTGSGILAITLKKKIPTLKVTATDISQAALQVAQENAQTLHADVTFKQGDLFTPIGDEKFDLIISNPPYIAYNEIAVMDRSVYQNEPHVALFAEHQGLAIYERLAAQLPTHLTSQGQALFEFGYHQQPALRQLFTQAWPQARLTFRKDIAGHMRMLQVQAPKEA